MEKKKEKKPDRAGVVAQHIKPLLSQSQHPISENLLSQRSLAALGQDNGSVS